MGGLNDYKEVSRYYIFSVHLKVAYVRIVHFHCKTVILNLFEATQKVNKGF